MSIDAPFSLELSMNLAVHPGMNENAWSAATTYEARLKTLDSRRIFRGVAYAPKGGTRR